MKHSFYSVRTFWHQDWAPKDFHVFHLGRKLNAKHWSGPGRHAKLLAVVSPCAILQWDAPLRKMRRRCHHTDLVPSCSQPVGHLTRVFPDSCSFRVEINSVYENSHALCLRCHNE